MGTADCAQWVPSFANTLAKSQKRERLFRVDGKYDWFLSTFSYCCLCLERLGSCQWSGQYTEGLVPSGIQMCMQGNCSRARGKSDVRCAACLQSSSSAQAVCICPYLTCQTAKTNINNPKILPVNSPAPEIFRAVEVHFGTKVLQSYKCLQLSWTYNLVGKAWVHFSAQLHAISHSSQSLERYITEIF